MATENTSVDSVLDTISNMSVMDVVELISKMEEKFGVSAAAAAVPMPMAGGAEAAEEEEQKTEQDIVLASFGENKIAVIKVVRTVTGLGLKEAKEMVEKAPSTVKEAVPTEEAAEIKKQLEEAGASVELK